MRLYEGGVAHFSCVTEVDDLCGRDTRLHKPYTNALSDLASCVLACRSSNTSEWIAVLPHRSSYKSKERFISRFLSNTMIDPIRVMKGFIPEMVSMMSESHQTIVLMLDYGMRWGIECLFSDFKYRGFSITKTHLVHANLSLRQ